MTCLAVKLSARRQYTYAADHRGLLTAAHVRLPPVLGCHPSLPSNAGTMMRLPARTLNPQVGRRSSRFVPSWGREVRSSSTATMGLAELRQQFPRRRSTEPRQQFPGCGRTVTRPSRRWTERSSTSSAAYGILAASLRVPTTLLVRINMALENKKRTHAITAVTAFIVGAEESSPVRVGCWD